MVILPLCSNTFMILLTLSQVKMPPMMEIITAEQLMEYLGEWSRN